MFSVRTHAVTLPQKLKKGKCISVCSVKRSYSLLVLGVRFAQLRVAPEACILQKKGQETEVFAMSKDKYKLSYDEVRVIVIALVELKNQLIAEGRYTDPVDELLMRFVD